MLLEVRRRPYKNVSFRMFWMVAETVLPMGKSAFRIGILL